MYRLPLAILSCFTIAALGQDPTTNTTDPITNTTDPSIPTNNGTTSPVPLRLNASAVLSSKLGVSGRFNFLTPEGSEIVTVSLYVDGLNALDPSVDYSYHSTLILFIRRLICQRKKKKLILEFSVS